MTKEYLKGLFLQNGSGEIHWYSYRDCYDVLFNREKYPAIASCLAKAVVEYLLEQTKTEPPFPYSPENYEEWLKRRYQEAQNESRKAHFLDSGKMPDGSKKPKFSDHTVKEMLFQRVMQNTNDASFLSRIGAYGTCDSVESGLMRIKYDESGAGDASANHCNLYHELIFNKLGYQLLPPSEFAKDGRFIDSVFIDPSFQLAIADYSKEYLPEILGMTDLLEWTGTIDAFINMRMLKKRGIDDTFYKVHVIADNPRNGHANQIKEIIKSYLLKIKTAEGDLAEQRYWRRIYQGYSTWKSILDYSEQELVNHLVKFKIGESAA